jgi:phospholipid transport system substrate-binding protein
MAMTTHSRRQGGRRVRAGVLAFAAASMLLLSMPLLGGLRAAMAGEPTDQIRAHIAAMYGGLGASASAASPAGMASVRKVADQMFDWHAMAREALGDQWAKRNAEEQNEFARLFVNLFSDAYLSKIRLAEADKFEYLGETVLGDDAVVRTRVVTKNGTAIPVSYRVRRDEAGRWRVYDLDVERISLVRNYRSQFASIIRRTSFEELLDRMKAAEDKRTGFEGGRADAVLVAGGESPRRQAEFLRSTAIDRRDPA